MDTDALQQALDQIKQAVDDAEAELMKKKMGQDEEGADEPGDSTEEDAAEGEPGPPPFGRK